MPRAAQSKGCPWLRHICQQTHHKGAPPPQAQGTWLSDFSDHTMCRSGSQDALCSQPSSSRSHSQIPAPPLSLCSLSGGTPRRGTRPRPRTPALIMERSCSGPGSGPAARRLQQWPFSLPFQLRCIRPCLLPQLSCYSPDPGPSPTGLPGGPKDDVGQELPDGFIDGPALG